MIEPRELHIPVPSGRGERKLKGILSLPRAAAGLVISICNDVSSHDHFQDEEKKGEDSFQLWLQARSFLNAGLGTLLVHLYSEEEASSAHPPAFDVDLFAGRLARVTGWLIERPETARLRLGFFGSGHAAAAAIQAAAKLGPFINAVVCCSGYPDLVAPFLPLVRAPTLLIAGTGDAVSLASNASALEQMRARKELRVMEGAEHWFLSPRVRDAIAQAATEWFLRYLAPALDTVAASRHM